MNKKTKIIIISSIVAVILISLCLTLFFINKNKKTEEEKIYIPESNVLIESYNEFATAKNMIFQFLIENTKNNLESSMAVEDFYSLDIYTIPMIIAGTDKSKTGEVGLFYSDVDCKYDGANDYTITAKDKSGRKARFEIKYDQETNSTKIISYIEKRIDLIYEYAKIGDEYAVQYCVNKNGKYTIGKLLYNEDKSSIKLGTYKDRKETPKEIYKNTSIINEKWIENANVLIEYKEGQMSSIVNGERVDLNQ